MPNTCKGWKTTEWPEDGDGADKNVVQFKQLPLKQKYKFAEPNMVDFNHVSYFMEIQPKRAHNVKNKNHLTKASNQAPLPSPDCSNVQAPILSHAHLKSLQA